MNNQEWLASKASSTSILLGLAIVDFPLLVHMNVSHLKKKNQG